MQIESNFHLTSADGGVFELGETTLIGRSDDCDLVLTEGHPSRRHAQIQFEDGEMYLEDLGSANGTFVNRIPIRTRHQLANGDRLAFGLANFVFHHRPPRAEEAVPTDPDATRLLDSAELERSHQSRFSLQNLQTESFHELHGPTLIGRQPEVYEEVALVVENPGVSSTHACLTPTEDGVLVEDMDSVNGTYLNDLRIHGPTIALHSDRLRFHLIEFTLHDKENSPANNQGTAIKDEAGQGSIESTDNPANDERKGGTVMLPINPNLPPLWEERPVEGTAILSQSDLAALPQSQPEYNQQDLGHKLDTPTLLILSGTGAGQPYKLQCLGNVNFWNIGRNPNAHDLSIVLDDPSVSDLHAKLICREGRWKLIDQMSTNSVFVNGKRHSSAYLKSSDHIRIGRVDALLLLPDEPTDGVPRATLGWLSRLLKRLGEH